MKWKDMILNPGNHCPGTSLGLLLLRLSAGLMMGLGHGWGKLSGFAEKADSFPDPLGVGHTLSLCLALGAEFFCSIAVILGIGTRVAVIPLLITMLVAAVLVHADDPWARKELALMYATAFLPLMFTGAGRFSLDARVCRARGYGAYACPLESKSEDKQSA